MREQEHNPKPRSATIVVFMLAVLVVSVVVAWWISHHRQTAVRRGGEIVAEIRRDGLKKFWGEGTREFFLVRRNGLDVGWHAALRKPVEGGYRGLDVYMHLASPGADQWESWTLSDDLRAGTYRAFGPSRLMKDRWARTEIALAHGHVTVTETQFALARASRAGGVAMMREMDTFTSRAAVGENYLPEGTLPLVLRQVGEHQVTASFKIILNEMPPMPTASGEWETRFGSIRAEFGGQETLANPAPTRTTVVTAVRGGFGHDSTERTYWSQDGTLQRLTAGPMEFVRVDQAELLKVFPKAIEELNALTKHPDTGYDSTEE